PWIRHTIIGVEQIRQSATQHSSSSKCQAVMRCAWHSGHSGSRAGGGPNADPVSDADSMTEEVSTVRLDRSHERPRRAVQRSRVLPAWLHVPDVNDAAVLSIEGDGQGDASVLHPER